jgi:hypothetical protein
VSNQNLSLFFRQWIKETGQPLITIQEIGVKKANDGFEIDIIISQDDPAKKLVLPVTFKGQGNERHFYVELDRENKKFIFRLSFPPQEVVIDEYYSVFRRLLPTEQPASLAFLPHTFNAAGGESDNPKDIRRLLAKPSDFRGARN